MLQGLLHTRAFKLIAMVVLVAFVGMIPMETGYAQTLIPQPGQMVLPTSSFTPALMRGIRVDQKDPFRLYFVMTDGEQVLAENTRTEEYRKLIKYFMASLITPNDDMWVNLSPVEADRIIPDNFSMTEMGRDLLAQDYLLKQFAASLLSPDTDLGKKFWAMVYEKSYEKYGTTNIPVDTFSKVWIMPDRADIYQKDDTAILVKSHLKVMLESDYLAAQGVAASADVAGDDGQQIAKEISRNIIVPVIEKEVNEGANFAQVRQVYSAMIMATWFKKALKDSLLGQVYADQSKVNGIALDDPGMKDRIYQQYLEAYKAGVFNFIREESDPVSMEVLPRKYFAGGMKAPDFAMLNTNVPRVDAAEQMPGMGAVNVVDVTLNAAEGVRFVVPPSPTMDKLRQEALAARLDKYNRIHAKLEQIRQELAKAGTEGVKEELPVAEPSAQAGLSGLVPAAPEVTAAKSSVPWKKYAVMLLTELQLLSPFMGSGSRAPEQFPAQVTAVQPQAASSAKVKSAEDLGIVRADQEVAAGSQQKADTVSGFFRKITSYVGDTIDLKRRIAADDRWKTIQRMVNGDAVSVIASMDKDNLHDTVKVFRSFAGNGKDPDAFQDFQYGPLKPEFRMFRVPSSNSGALDYSRVEEWEEIKNMLEVEKEQEANKNLVVVVNWKEDGQEKKGILWAGATAARINAEMAVAASVDRKFTEDLMTVLDIRDLEEQRRQISEKFGLDSLNNEQLFVGVRVARDAFGNITKINGFIEADEVDVQYSAKPAAHTDLVVRQNGKTEIIKFWPFRDQALKVFSVLTPDELSSGGSTVNNNYSDQENPYTRGEIVFGQNYNYKNKSEIDIADMMSKINKKALAKYKDYLEGKRALERGFAGFNLFLSFTPLALPMNLVSTASKLAYELATQPSLIVSRNDMESFFGKYLYLKEKGLLNDSVAIQDTIAQDTAWDALTRSEKKKWTADALKDLGKFYTQDDMDVIFHYMEVRKDEQVAMFILNQFSTLAPYISWLLPTTLGYIDPPGLMGSWTNPDGTVTTIIPTWWQFDRAKYPILNDILNQRYISFTGELNLPQVLALFSSGRGMNNIPITQLFDNTRPRTWWTGGMDGKQVKPTWLNGSFFEKLFSIVGVTVNLQSVINALEIDESPLDAPFKNAPTVPRINLYLAGYPVSTEFEVALNRNLNRMVNDTSCAAYMVHDGTFRSKAYQYSQKEFDALFVTPGVTRVVIGKVALGDRGRNVPVYMALETNPDGTKRYRVFIPTEVGLKKHKEAVQKDIANYNAYEDVLKKGGYVEHTGAQGGTYQQNNATGLFESISQQGQIYLDGAYTWDQMLMVQRALLSNDTAIATGVLDNYLTQFNATTKSGADFQGFTTTFRAYTGANIGPASSAATAMVGQTIMAYEKKTGDMRYHHMLKPMAEWLLKMQKNTGTGGVRLGPMDNDTIWTGPQKFVRRSYSEPNALVYSFFDAYARQPGVDQKQYIKAAGAILGWAKTYGWDGMKGLLNHTQYMQGNSSDAQTRWMRALGVQRFTEEFINGKQAPDGKADSFRQYVDRMVDQFEVTVVDAHTGLTVTLLDLADPRVAEAARGLDDDGKVIRMGFPEVTAEFIAVLNEAKTLFPEQADHFQTLIDRYTASLNALKAAPELDGALPQATGKDIPTGFGWNTPIGAKALASLAQLDLTLANKNVLNLDSLGIELPPIDRPATQAGEAELIMPKVGTDYDAKRAFVAKLIELKEYEGNKLVWANPSGQEIIYTNAQGRKVHVVLVPSTSKVEQRRKLMEENRDVADQIAEAFAGKNAYANGGVIFSTPDGSRIGGVQDQKTVDSLIEKINALSVAERNWIFNKSFSNFNIRFDVNGDGIEEDVVATIMWPLDAPVTISRINPVSGLLEEKLFINGRLIKTTDANGTSTIDYDHFRLESSSSSVSDKGIETDKTLTLQVKITDPFMVKRDQIDPYDTTMVKLHMDMITEVPSIDTYGLFDRPVQSVTARTITINQFDDHGKWIGAVEHVNKGSLDVPIKGKLLRTLTTEGVEKVRAHPAFQNGHFTFVKKTEKSTGKVTFIVFDDAKFGRRYAEVTVTSKGLDINLLQYDEDFLAGRVPTHSIKYGAEKTTPKLANPADKNAGTLSEFLRKNSMIRWDDGTFEYASDEAINAALSFTQKHADEILVQDKYGTTIDYKFVLNVIRGFDNGRMVVRKGIYGSRHGMYFVRFKDKKNDAFSTTAFIRDQRTNLVNAGALVAQDGAYTLSLNKIKKLLEDQGLDRSKLTPDDFKNNGKCIYFKSTPEEDEIEVGDSLYRYSTYNKDSKPFEVVKRMKITEVDGKWVLVVARETLNGLVTRVFGVVVGPSSVVKNEDIGREIIQLYSWKTADGRTINRAVVDHDSLSTAIDARIRAARGYTGEEKIKHIYDVLNASDESYLFDQSRAVLRGYAVVTGDTIFTGSAEPWTVAEEITLDGKFVAARALDRFGKERAVITKLPDAPDVYQIEVVSYGQDGLETGRVIHKARKAGTVYELGVEMARFNKLSGEQKSREAAAFETASQSLSSSDRRVLKDALANIVALTGDPQVNVGVLTKTNDGTFVIYRMAGDPRDRIIAQHALATDSWQINLAWDDDGRATASRIIKGGQVVSMAGSEASAMMGDVLNSLTEQENISRNFMKAQEDVKVAPLSLTDYMALYGIESTTVMPTVKDVLYQKKGQAVFDSKGRVVSDDVTYDQNTVEKQVTMYLVPNDPQGRTFMTRYPTAEGEKVVVNMWNWQDRVKAPEGIIPGSITIDGDRIEVEEFSGLIDTVQWYNMQTGRVEVRRIADITGGKTEHAFVYKVTTNNESRLLQRIYLNGGDVLQEFYPYRVATLANKVAQNEAGVMEVVQYHMGLPYAVPEVAFKSNTGEWIKQWQRVSYTLDEEKAAEQIFTAKEPLAPKKQSTWKYTYNRFGEQVNGEKRIMPDAFQEIEDNLVKPLPGVNGASPWYTFGGIMLALGLALGGVKAFFKRKWRASAQKTRVVPAGPGTGSGDDGPLLAPVRMTPEHRAHLRTFMQDVLGPDVSVRENNAIVMRVAEIVSKLGKGLDVTLQDLGDPRQAFDHVAVMEQFEKWLKDLKEDDLKKAAAGPSAAYLNDTPSVESLMEAVKEHITPLEFIVLSEICFSLAKELRHSNPSVVWYYLYKALLNVEENKGIGGLPQFFADMNTGMDAIRILLNNEYPAGGPNFAKNDRRFNRSHYVVCEDIEDKFKDVEFLIDWERIEVGKKLDFLNNQNKSLVDARNAALLNNKKMVNEQDKPLGLKMEKDAVGFKNYMKNLWPVVRTLLPIFVITAIVPAVLYLGFGIGFTWLGMMATMGVALLVSNLFIMAGNSRYIKAVTALNGSVPDQRKVEISNFNKFFNVFSVLFVGWNYAAFSFSYPILVNVFLVGVGSVWTIPLVIIGVLMTFTVIAFQVVSSWALAYPTLTFFAWMQGNKDRVGEVKSAQQALEKVARARQEFRKALAPSLQGRYEEIWKKYADKLIDALMRDYMLGENEKPYLQVIMDVLDPSVAIGSAEAEAIKKATTIEEVKAIKKKAIEKQSAAIKKTAEFKEFLSSDKKREELHDRIVRSVGSWYMNMPQMLEWKDWPTLTPVSTAFNEDIANDYIQLNDADKNGGMTPLNWFISQNAADWLRMIEKDITDPEVKKLLERHAQAVIRDKKIEQKLDVGKDIERIILRWVAMHFVRVDRSIEEMRNMYEAYKFWAEEFFPPEQVQEKLQEKLQMYLIFAGFERQSLSGSFLPAVNEMNLVRALTKFPELEVFLGTGPLFKDSLYRLKTEFAGDVPGVEKAYQELLVLPDVNGDASKIKPAQIIERFFDVISTPVVMDSEIGVAVSGKTTSQNAAFQYVRGEVWLPFDSNLSVRFEEAVKSPMILAEFKRDLKTGLVLCGEHINTKKYSWMGEGLAFGEEAWTNVMQRALDLFGASGFYGHSAFIRSDITRAAGGLSTFYTSEDLLLAMRFWLAGYDTIHREYVLFGKGRDRSYVSSLVALGKWAEGSAELILGRQMKRAMQSPFLHMPRKMMLNFALSFYEKKPLVMLMSLVYLMTFTFLGVSPYVGFSFGVVFGIVGMFVSQAINITGLLYLSERHGFLKGVQKFLAMFPKLYLTFVAVIPTYAQRMLKGFQGASGFVLSPRGYDLEMIPFKSKKNGDISIWAWPADEKINAKRGVENKSANMKPLVAAIISGVIGTVLLLPWFGAVGAGIGITVLIAAPIFIFWKWQKLIFKHAFRLQIIMGLVMLPFVAWGIVLWGGMFGSFAIGLAWTLQFAMIIASIISSVNDHPRATRWSMLGAMGIIGVSSFLFSPIFILFAFSGFYLGQPVVWLLMPFMGHIRPWVSMKWALDSAWDWFKSWFVRSKEPVPPSVGPAAVPPPTVVALPAVPVQPPAPARAGWLKRRVEALTALQNYIRDKMTRDNAELQKIEQKVAQVEAPDQLGGIDMNADHLAINIKVDGNGMPLPVGEQAPEIAAITGLTPVIRSITSADAGQVPVLLELMTAR